MSIVIQEADYQVVVNETPPARVSVVSPGISGGGSGGSGGGVQIGDPFDEYFVATNLVAGSSAVFNCGPITALRYGRLWGVDFSASVPIRLDVEFVNGPRTIRATIYKLTGNPEPWFPPDPRFMKLLGDGSAHFGCTMTNLSVKETADMKVTMYYDEVDS